MEELKVSTLGVMQAGYRLSAIAMSSLIEDTRAGAVFDKKRLRSRDGSTALVAVTKFEDGRLMICDGLHRVTAIMVARPTSALLPEEYLIYEMPYDKFLEINFEVGFVTPFDPRFEVRVADWHDFRREVQERLRDGIDPVPFIRQNRSVYASPRERCHDSLSSFFREKWKYGGVLS